MYIQLVIFYIINIYNPPDYTFYELNMHSISTQHHHNDKRIYDLNNACGIIPFAWRYMDCHKRCRALYAHFSCVFSVCLFMSTSSVVGLAVFHFISFSPCETLQIKMNLV